MTLFLLCLLRRRLLRHRLLRRHLLPLLIFIILSILLLDLLAPPSPPPRWHPPLPLSWGWGGQVFELLGEEWERSLAAGALDRAARDFTSCFEALRALPPGTGGGAFGSCSPTDDLYAASSARRRCTAAARAERGGGLLDQAQAPST